MTRGCHTLLLMRLFLGFNLLLHVLCTACLIFIKLIAVLSIIIVPGKNGGFNHFETDWRRLLAHSARTLSSPAVIAVPTKRLWLLSDGADTPELGQCGRSWKVGNRWSSDGANLFQTPVSLLNWSLSSIVCVCVCVCVVSHKWDASLFKAKILLLKI